MPLATSSPLVMPPKMLMKIERTLGSLVMTSSVLGHHLRRGAATDVEEVLDGSPPTWLTMSTVDMASPAPFAITPT